MKITNKHLIALTEFTKEELKELISDGGYMFTSELSTNSNDRVLILLTGKGGLIKQVEAFREENFKESIEIILRKERENNGTNPSIH